MPKKVKVTTRRIAEECGLSQTAVSMILSGREDIHFKQETIDKVMETASALGYVYRKRERKPDNALHKTILIMCPSLSTEYYTTLVRSITKSAATKGLHTMTTYTMREKKAEEMFLRTALDSGFYGVIYTYAPQAADLINQLRNKVHFVLINDYNDKLRVPLIELDSKKSGRMIGDHLLSLGHRHIAYMTTPLSAHELPRIRRLEGLKEAWTAAGLSADQVEIVALTQLQWDYYLLGNRYYDAGYQLVTGYLKRESHPATAFIGTNDQISFGIMDALQKMGFRIPDDYSVCGFDNTLAASFESISLTTIDHSVEDKGNAAIRMLLNSHASRNNQEDRRSALLRLEYEPELMIRQSTGPVRL